MDITAVLTVLYQCHKKSLNDQNFTSSTIWTRFKYRLDFKTSNHNDTKASAAADLSVDLSVVRLKSLKNPVSTETASSQTSVPGKAHFGSNSGLSTKSFKRTS